MPLQRDWPCNIIKLYINVTSGCLGRKPNQVFFVGFVHLVRQQADGQNYDSQDRASIAARAVKTVLSTSKTYKF